MKQAPFSNVKKIAVLRASALGDLIFALPALGALRQAYPQAEIVYLGRAWHAAFLPGRLAGPHRVQAVPPARTGEQISQGLVVDPAAEEDFIQQMRAEQFDLAVQMHGAGEYSNPLILSFQARFSVGLKGRRAAPLDRWIPYLYYQNEVARLLEVAALAGGPATWLQPRLPVLESDLAAAAPFLESIRRPYAVLHPGSTDPRRRWQPEKYAAVGDWLAAQGMEVILTGQGEDAPSIYTTASTMRAPVTNLCDRLSLAGLAGLLSKAALFVGNDSGPLHLALAVGTKAVGLFWTEYALNSLPLWRANFYPLIAWQRHCPRCGRFVDKDEADFPQGPCTHHVSFIEEIPEEDVIQGAGSLL